MATVTANGKPVKTSGELPKVGTQAKDFHLVKQDLGTASLKDFKGKKKILNVFPSIDTSVCSKSLVEFQKQVGTTPGAMVINISMDLPFAHKRFCSESHAKDAVTLSAFNSTFATDYGLQIAEGPLKGLCSRVVIVLDDKDKVIYVEQVAELSHEPNYAAALKAVK